MGFFFECLGLSAEDINLILRGLQRSRENVVVGAVILLENDSMILLKIFADFPPWLFALLGSGIGGFLGAYLAQKGKNLATKEDIEEITHKVESVKISLSDDSHVARENLAREKKAYELLWTGISSLEDMVMQDGVTHSLNDRHYVRSVAKFSERLNRHRPFLPDEISDTLAELLTKISGCAAYDAGTDEYNSYYEEMEKLKDKATEMIRERLKKIPALS